jgi:hypothetical protein
MKRGLRKFSLTAHITLSVGWIGAVSAYLVLVVAAMTSNEVLTLRAAWVAMEVIGWYLIVPLALASLVTGCVMALGTPWGLLRHYWVVSSLVLTVVATVVLLQHMPTVSTFARMAAEPGIVDTGALRAGLRSELLHAGVGLLVLFAIETLNVYKPLGLTAYGRRREPLVATATGSTVDAPAGPAGGFTAGAPRWVQVVGFHAIALALLFVIMHVASGGLSHH